MEPRSFGLKEYGLENIRLGGQELRLAKLDRSYVTSLNTSPCLPDSCGGSVCIASLTVWTC